jgi:peptidoglycan/xylan/chitin deacetylase (PgdA/CDA1 family)
VSDSNKIAWPNGAKCAVMLTFDVDGSTSWINRDRRVEGWPKTKSLGEYGPWRAVPRILDLLEEYRLPATFFVPGKVVESYPKRMQEIVQSGHEVGHHGYMHELFVDKSLDEQREIISRSQGIFREVLGREASGFRTPSGDFARETPALLQEMGFRYSSSMRGDDRPYRTRIDGEETDLIEIPAHWELDDFPQFGFNYFPPMPKGQDRIASHRLTLNNWIREFDGYYRYGLCYVVMMHPQVMGKPGRVLMLDKLIRHIKQHPDVWFATGSDVADWWSRNY